MVAKEKSKKMKADKAAEKQLASEGRVGRVARQLADPYSQLTCLFLLSAVRLFEDVNVILQKDEPCIHVLHAVLLQQLQSILMRFVKPSVIAASPNLTSVQYKDKKIRKTITMLQLEQQQKSSSAVMRPSCTVDCGTSMVK